MKMPFGNRKGRAARRLFVGVSICALAGGAAWFGPLACHADPAAPGQAAGDAKAFEQKIPGTDASFKMLPIPGGKFKMGSPAAEKGRKADEGPQFEVEVEPFFMEEHEVTWAEYNPYRDMYDKISKEGRQTIAPEKMADAISFPTPMYEMDAGPVLGRMGRGNEFPAVIMSQFAAKQYCKWLSKKTGRFYRLPTEAEWEYACRAGSTTAYSFGDDPASLGDYGWFFDNSPTKDSPDGAYHEVMQKKPNTWGLYDMHGNVAEWVMDRYDADSYKKFDGKSVNWKDSIAWATAPYPRLVRGGGWESEAPELRSAARKEITAKENLRDPQLPKSPYWLTEGFWVGFRVISPVNQPTEAEKLKYWEVDNDLVKEVLTRDREEKAIVTPGEEKK